MPSTPQDARAVAERAPAAGAPPLSTSAIAPAAPGRASRTRGANADVSGSGRVWLLPFALLMFAVICVPVRLLEPEGLPRYRALRAEREQVQASNERLGREVEALRKLAARLQKQPEAVERIARDELGMLREDELLFQFAD